MRRFPTKRVVLGSKQLIYAPYKSIRNYHHQSIFCHGQYSNSPYTYNTVRNFCTEKSTRPEIKTPIQQEVEQIHSQSSTEDAKSDFTDEYEEAIPEPPESGKRLLRDGIIVGCIAMAAAWIWTIYKQRRENYGNRTLTEVYSVRAHIQHALQARDIESKTFHLTEAEAHCRKAMQDLGGGYLHKSTESETNIEYDPQIVALHVQLGKICYLLHKYQSAVDNYLVVLKALTQEFGYKSRELMMPCRQISDCYMHLGQNQMAILFLERALGIMEEITVKGDINTHNEYAPICQQMAVVLRKQYKWKESIHFTNKAIKGAKSLLGENHIQIAHMLLGRSCAEMELKQWEIAEKSARAALQIVESGSNLYSQSAQQYENMENDDFSGNRMMEGGVKNTIKNKLQNGLTGNKTEAEQRYEQEMQIQQQRKQMMANAVVSGVSSTEQLVEMKCSILYIIGQSLIEQERVREAEMILNNALRYAVELNDTTKQLLIHDQLRDVQNIIREAMARSE